MTRRDEMRHARKNERSVGALHLIVSIKNVWGVIAIFSFCTWKRRQAVQVHNRTYVTW